MSPVPDSTDMATSFATMVSSATQETFNALFHPIAFILYLLSITLTTYYVLTSRLRINASFITVLGYPLLVRLITLGATSSFVFNFSTKEEVVQKFLLPAVQVNVANAFVGVAVVIVLLNAGRKRLAFPSGQPVHQGYLETKPEQHEASEEPQALTRPELIFLAAEFFLFATEFITPLAFRLKLGSSLSTLLQTASSSLPTSASTSSLLLTPLTPAHFLIARTNAYLSLFLVLASTTLTITLLTHLTLSSIRTLLPPSLQQIPQLTFLLLEIFFYSALLSIVIADFGLSLLRRWKPVSWIAAAGWGWMGWEVVGARAVKKGVQVLALGGKLGRSLKGAAAAGGNGGGSGGWLGAAASWVLWFCIEGLGVEGM